MGISRNLADVLHRIVDHLPVREEQTALDLHTAVNDEVEKAFEPETDETDPGTGDTDNE